MTKTHLGFPYIINFNNLTQKWLTNGYVRSVRRIKQAPYPLVKVRLEELVPVIGEVVQIDLNERNKLCFVIGRRSSDIRNSARCVNGQTQGKVIGSTAALNASDNGKKNGKKKNGGKNKNGETTPANLARAILQNLNIFSEYIDIQLIEVV